MSFCDEFERGFGWVEDEGPMRRCGHALLAGGGVWLLDAFDHPGLDDRIRELGEPAGVVQLLDRHGRDGEAIARRLGVPVHRLEAPAPFEAVALATPPRWQEIALWWSDARVLVCADALGTVGYFRARGERLAVHPLLRPWPPRRLGRLQPDRILVGHGTGVDDGATAALAEALATARRRIPAYVCGGVRVLTSRRVP